MTNSATYTAGEVTDVPAPTLLMGMATAVAAGAFVGWALLPLPRTVAGLPLFTIAAVATTLWSGLSFLRRKYPVGVLAEGFYLMGAITLVRPVATFLGEIETLTVVAGVGGAFVTGLTAVVVAGVLFTAGWRLDTRARKARIRRSRRRLRASMSRKRGTGPGTRIRAGRSNVNPTRRPSNRQRNRDE